METSADNAAIPAELRSRYSSLRILGSGAMGAVYRAHDANLDKDVAIKVLKQRQISSEIAIRFQQEAKVASKLKHHNLVTLMDFGISEKSEPYIIMESVEGKSLADILDEVGALNLPAAVNILVQICEGMEHAHNSGVVHRDLKPSNVIVSGEDLVTAKIKVLDFGIAKLDDTSGGVTRTGTVLGTPYYMSPEQFSGENVDRRTDIYAAGSMLFRMLTNCHPFEGDTLLEIMQDKKSLDAPRMNDVNPDLDIPEAIEEVVAKSLARSPEDRHATMSEFRDALFHAMEKLNVPITIHAENQKYNQEKKTVPRYAYALAAVLILSVSIIALLGYNELSSANARRELEAAHATNPKVKKVDRIFDNLPKINEEVWEFDRPHHAVYAKAMITDNDVEQLYQVEKGDIERFYTGYNDEQTTRQEQLTSNGWSTIAKFPLTDLSVNYSCITDDDVKPFAKLPNLKHFDFSRNKLGDQMLKFFENNDSMRSLLGKATNVTDEGVKSIVTMKNLKKLSLFGTKVSDKSLELISKNLPDLENLDVGECDVSNDGMRFLADMPKLTAINIGHTKVTKKGLEILKNLKLKELNLESNKNIDDSTLQLITAQWPNLTVLHIGDTKVSGPGLRYVTRLKQIRNLHINALTLRDEDMAPVLASPSIAILHVMSTALTDKTAQALESMPKLKHVEFHHCPNVSTAAIRKLRTRGVKVFKFEENGEDVANEVMSDLLVGE